MNQKYEITDIVHPQYPWLHRIRALRDVREDVHAGDLGGFVQSEENLSQEGQCWVANNAVAAEESYISGDAIMWDYSCARGCAVISGKKPNRWRSHHRRSCYRNLWLCPWKRPYIWKCQNLCECCYRRNPCNHGKSFCLRGAWRRDRGS